MITYLVLSRYTDHGIQRVKDAPTRIDNFKKAVRLLGGEVHQLYLMLGGYDSACIISVPDDETMARLALAVGSWGSVRTQSFRVFAEPEFRRLVTSLPAIG
jgi:uncharacterized protein with GYD domain